MEDGPRFWMIFGPFLFNCPAVAKWRLNFLTMATLHVHSHSFLKKGYVTTSARPVYSDMTVLVTCLSPAKDRERVSET